MLYLFPPTVVQLLSRAIATGDFYDLYPREVTINLSLGDVLRESRGMTGSIVPTLSVPGLRKADAAANDLFSSLCFYCNREIEKKSALPNSLPAAYEAGSSLTSYEITIPPLSKCIVYL